MRMRTMQKQLPPAVIKQGTINDRNEMEVNVSFYHGLGDISNFARLLPLYKKYGIDIGTMCSKDKQIIIKTAGGRVLEDSSQIHDSHGWFIQAGTLDQEPGNARGWEGNKTGVNIRHYGLEQKANMEQLWAELKQIDLQIKPLIAQQDWDIVDFHTQDWPKPLVLWHSIGNTNQRLKSFSEQQQREFTYEFLNRFEGTLLLLDWDSRVTWTRHNRLKHLIPELGSIDVSRLAALMYKSQLMIGIDSGPFYLSALTSIPSVGCFFDNMHPSEYMIPTKRALTLTCGGRANTLDRAKRFEFQIVGTNGSMAEYAEWCSKMLLPLRYLPMSCNKAADVQLQQVVQKLCRGNGNGLSTIYDRNHSFDVLLQECKKRWSIVYPNQQIQFVETGCIRADEDWAGAGFSTAVFGRYCQLIKGHLTSIDLDENHCNYARKWCRQFEPHVTVTQSRGDDGLRNFSKEIHVLYLDSLDSEHPAHQEENLKEFKAAEPKLRSDSIVCIDDTPAPGVGKGGLTVQHMLQNGWKYLYQGYQVVMVRK